MAKEKSKRKSNLARFIKSRADKKYLYLKQALGMKEITPDQFTKLAKGIEPVTFNRATARKKAIAKKLEISST